jgi:hypothetical protein
MSMTVSLLFGIALLIITLDYALSYLSPQLALLARTGMLRLGGAVLRLLWRVVTGTVRYTLSRRRQVRPRSKTGFATRWR